MYLLKKQLFHFCVLDYYHRVKIYSVVLQHDTLNVFLKSNPITVNYHRKCVCNTHSHSVYHRTVWNNINSIIYIETVLSLS